MDSLYTNGRPTLDDLFWFVSGFRDARIIALCGSVLLVCRLTFEDISVMFTVPDQDLGAPVDLRPRARVLLVPTVHLEQSTLFLSELPR